MNLPDLIGKVRIDNSQAKTALGEVKAESASASAAMGTAGKSAMALAGGFTAAATAGSVVVGVVADMVHGFTETGSKLVDLNKQLGIGVVEIQKIQFAAKQSGVEFGAVTTALAKMEQTASKTPEKFEQLGISFEQVKNSQPEELLALISDGMKGIGEESDRTRIAMEIFGRGGSQMLKMLMDDYRGLTKEAEGTGLMTAEMAAKADRLGDASAKLDDTIKKLKDNLGAAFASPEMISLMEKTAGLIGLMAQNAEKLLFAAKTIAMSGTNLGGDLFAWLAGKSQGEMPDFGDVKGGSSSDQTAVKNNVWGNPSAVISANMRDAARAAKTEIKDAMAVMQNFIDMELEGSRDATRARAEEWRVSKAVMQDYIDSEAEGSRAATAARKENARELNNEIKDFIDAESKASHEADQARAAQEAEKWRSAMQGIDMLAGAIGGKFGGIVGAIGQMVIGLKAGADKFQTIAMFAGQVGQIIGGKAGGALSGAAGGAMAGSAFGLPGQIIGGLIGGIAGLFGAGKAQKEAQQKAAAQAAADAAKAAAEKQAAGVSSFSSGLSKFSAGGFGDQASLDRGGRYAMGAFGAQMQQTGDIFGALDSIAPALDAMAKSAKEFGLEMPKGVASLLQLQGLDDNIKSQVTGLNEMTKGISDAGLMTSDMFNDLGADAVATKAKLEDAGLSGAQSMALMQPTLQQLYEAQKLHGYAVDESTQALLDEAKAQGMVGDQFMSTGAQMVELMKVLILAVGGELPDAFKNAADGASGLADAVDRIPRNVDIKASVHYDGGGGWGGGDSGDGSGLNQDGGGPGFASGTTFRNFGSGTRVTLHGEEAVMTRPQVDRLVSMAVAGAPGSTVPMGGGSPSVMFGDIHVHANDAAGGQDAAKAFIRLLDNGSLLTAVKDRLGISR